MQSLYDEIVPVLDQEFPGVPKWKSFALWWLIAHGLDYRGKGKDYLVDGSGDGGIDVIAWPVKDFEDDRTYVIQSKYYKNTPGLKQVERFIEAVNALSGPKKEYDNWLDTVGDKLLLTYNKLRAKTLNGKIKFLFITTSKLSAAARNGLFECDVEVLENEEMRRLLQFYKRGQTPRVPSLIITPKSKPSTITKTDKVQMMVFSVHLKEFASAYKKHDTDLFAGNIRFGGVKGANSARVKEGINHTLSKHDDEFVFSHNGITVVCRGIEKIGKKIKLLEPSVVNGAQTITYIGDKWFNNISDTQAEVLVKLIKVQPNASFEELETDIAIRSNTQIKVDFSDLIVTEPALVTLQKRLVMKKIHLERKKGDRASFVTILKIKKERLVQIMACLKTSLGPTAPKKLQELFKKHDAVELIRSYVDNNKIADVVSLIWLDWLVHETIKSYGHNTGIKRAKTAGFAIFTTAEKALQKANVWSRLVNHVYAQENYKEFEKNSEVKELIIACRNYILSKSSKQKKNEPAFYKNKSQTEALVSKAINKFYKKAEKIYS
jgi:hypothetical protein